MANVFDAVLVLHAGFLKTPFPRTDGDDLDGEVEVIIGESTRGDFSFTTFPKFCVAPGINSLDLFEGRRAEEISIDGGFGCRDCSAGKFTEGRMADGANDVIVRTQGLDTHVNNGEGDEEMPFIHFSLSKVKLLSYPFSGI